jgi:hypothetical protein
MDADKIIEIKAKIADLEGRWPSHSVPPSMWRELEELEEELEKAREDESRGSHTEGGDAEVGNGG